MGTIEGAGEKLSEREKDWGFHMGSPHLGLQPFFFFFLLEFFSLYPSFFRGKSPFAPSFKNSFHIINVII